MAARMQRKLVDRRGAATRASIVAATCGSSRAIAAIAGIDTEPHAEGRCSSTLPGCVDGLDTTAKAMMHVNSTAVATACMGLRYTGKRMVVKV